MRSSHQLVGRRLGRGTLLCSVLWAFPGSAQTTAAASSSGASSAAEATRIQQYVDSTSYASSDVKYSFETKFGENIDCIDFYAQPSVKAMIKQGRTVLTRPPADLPTIPAPSTPPAVSAAFGGEPDQNGHSRRCPAGSVPVMHQEDRAASIQRLAQAGGLDAFMRSRQKPLAAPRRPPPAGTCPASTAGAGYSHIIASQSVTNEGGIVIASTYTPAVAGPNEHSLSQIWSSTGQPVLALQRLQQVQDVPRSGRAAVPRLSARPRHLSDRCAVDCCAPGPFSSSDRPRRSVFRDVRDG